MSDSTEKKPSFMEGLMAGWAPKDKKPDSEELKNCKEYIQNMGLSPEDRVGLAAWILSNEIKSSIISALEDD